ncbi:hypothetical protein MTP04_22740 [Lysinibacillus sp. PLM2]|nr:hypothetical protein D7X33_27015 [Butyricicoccus sp. 1XD8-22]BDH62144.1 hypothetical protein MTP04_22740 [Lysinibacillus sp. PLM2]
MVRLQSVFDTEAGKNNYPEIKKELLSRFNVESISEITNMSVCETFSCRNGYGTNTYTGKLKDDVVVSEIELAMIIDNGYSFFGGSSTINSDKTFKVEIWFD